MPATAPKDSCSPTWAAEKGFHISSTARAKASAVKLSRSRPSSGATWSRASITAARLTDGVPPATPQKSTARINVHMAPLRFPLPSSRVTAPARKARCIPDTATVWDSPVRWREVVKGSLRFSRPPVTMPWITGATSGGKARPMPPFSFWDR